MGSHKVFLVGGRSFMYLWKAKALELTLGGNSIFCCIQSEKKIVSVVR
jgi:hypothetical protein